MKGKLQMEQMSMETANPAANKKTATKKRLRNGDPGFVNARLQSYMAIKSWPADVTHCFRNKIRTEYDKDQSQHFDNVLSWWWKIKRPEFENENKAPLSEEVVDALTNYLLKLLNDDLYWNIPTDAVKSICEFAVKHADAYDFRKPTVIHTKLSTIIWFAMLILGANGREFSFSSDAFATELDHLLKDNIYPMTIYRIVQTLKLSDELFVFKKGIRQGRCSRYVLSEGYEKEWERLLSKPKNSQTNALSSTVIKNKFPWVFSQYNG